MMKKTLCNRLFISLLLCLPMMAVLPLPAQPLAAYKTLEWTDLMPEEDLKLLESIPQVDHESLSSEELAQDQQIPSNNNMSAFEDQIANAIAESASGSAPKQRTWKDALVSTSVRKEFDQKNIRLAGYISPISWDENNIVTELFFVPYFGACIHVPPPPPNQLIYIKLNPGIKLVELYEPFWVQGKLVIESTEKEIGLSSYSMVNARFSAYTEPDSQ